MKGKKERPDALIFDFDGTLFDTEDGIIDSLAYSIKKNGLKPKTRKELKAMIGVPLQDIYEKMARQGKISNIGKLVESCVKDHRAKYKELILKETRLYPHVRETLQKLKRRKVHLALATTKPKIFAVRILKHYRMDGLFDTIIGSPVGKGKRELPKEKILDKAARKMMIGRFGSKKAAYVGDRKYDIIAAKHHKMISVGVTYGVGGREELKTAGAEHLIDRFDNLMRLFG